jgi:hypothetical protein
MMFAWLSIAPFGLAVVPEVWITVAVRSAGDRLPALAPQPPVRGVVVGARDDVVVGQRPLGELAGRVHRDDVLERRDLGSDRLDLRGLLRVLDEDHLRLDVVEDERRLVRLRLGVDRGGDRAGGQGGEVADRPLATGPAHDRGGITLTQAQVTQAERELGDPVPHLPVGARLPAAVGRSLAAGLRPLPADRLLVRVALDGPVDQVEEVLRLALGRNDERFAARVHRLRGAPGRWSSVAPSPAVHPSRRIASSSPCATMSRWI